MLVWERAFPRIGLAARPVKPTRADEAREEEVR
jgi:hypothetical protein